MLSFIIQEGEENIGMAMIFTLVSVALDWLTQNHEDKLTQATEAKERKQAEAEEAERKRFEGTRVTVETFMAWKGKFDAEMAELKRIAEKKREAEAGKSGGGSGGGGVTGKQLFTLNADLNDSDINFLAGEGDEDDNEEGGGGGGGGAGGDVVEVDETLFQDMEDLDFDDDDDEDFDPSLVDDDDD